MTDAYEDGTHLVRVRAQVMIRDDSTGGWVPMGGGGLSNVSVRKRAVSCDLDQCKHEYLIFGKRISDQSVVLSCIIKKDFEYNKVMPTFHHWKTGEKKFGLTFQTAADARAFDKGLRTAVDELLDGISDSPAVQNDNKGAGEVGDDDVFMTLNLPVERGDSRSSSDSSSRGSRHTPPQEQVQAQAQTPTQTQAQAQAQALPLTQPQVHRSQVGDRNKLGSENDSPTSADKCPYLQLAAVHEYICPNVEGAKLTHNDSSASMKKSMESLPAVHSKPGKKDKKKQERQRCTYCQEYYLEEENKKGVCEYAPDCMRSAVDELACIRCARCMLYHCMSDAEGEFAQHPCGCNSEEGSGRRWLGLALLSIVVPCLWLYPPLRACHWCGVRCGLCGGRHRPAS